MTPSPNSEQPAFARGRNPELERTDLRASVRKFTMDVIDAEVNFRVRHTDASASRNQVVNEILEAWALVQWHKASMTMALAPDNPLPTDKEQP